MHKLATICMVTIVSSVFGFAIASCGQPAVQTAQLQPTSTLAAPATATIAVTPTTTPTTVPTTAPEPTSAPTIVPTAAPTAQPSTAASASSMMDHSGHSMSAMGENIQTNIKLFMFKPIEIKVGTSVTWTNQDNIEHSVTSGTPPSSDGAWDSGLFEQGKSYTHAFTEPGTFAYFCMRHNSMTGIVTVVP